MYLLHAALSPPPTCDRILVVTTADIVSARNGFCAGRLVVWRSSTVMPSAATAAYILAAVDLQGSRSQPLLT